jgi:hypothetical protein
LVHNVTTKARVEVSFAQDEVLLIGRNNELLKNMLSNKVSRVALEVAREGDRFRLTCRSSNPLTLHEQKAADQVLKADDVVFCTSSWRVTLSPEHYVELEVCHFIANDVL